MPVVAGLGGAHGRSVVPVTGTTPPVVAPMPVSAGREDDERLASTPHPARHWDHAYAQGASTRSWFQPEPTMSVRMLQAAGVSAGDSVLDVGGGASGALLARGSSDVTVLDISAVGLRCARRLLGPDATRARWVVADVLAWRPQRRYQLWHDRAVFRFLTGSTDRRLYLDTLNAATATARVDQRPSCWPASGRLLVLHEHACRCR